MRATEHELHGGERTVPWFCGVAYREPLRLSVVYYPLPFSLLVRLGRELYFRLVARDPSWWERKERQIRIRTEASREEEWRRGFDAGQKYGPSYLTALGIKENS